MNKNFYKKLWITEEELLRLVRTERQNSEEFSYAFKLEIEADLKLLKNKRDKKKDEKLAWDSTLFNTHRALMARSYQSKNTINIKWDKGNWVEREVKMLNTVFKEDHSTSQEKAIKYYLYSDKYATWVSIKARTWWDGVYKKNKFMIVNPLTWLPQEWGDYFTGEWTYTWFFSIERIDTLEQEWFDKVDFLREYDRWAVDTKERQQRIQWLFPQYMKEVTDVVYSFLVVNGYKIWTRTASLDNVLLWADFIAPSSPLEEKNPEAVSFPLAFYYWNPDRDNPFGDRPANYIRDIQKLRARQLNLAVNKMEAELYPMYVYNKDYLRSSDLQFWFNKWIAISTWVDWANVNLDNLVRPIQKDLRLNSFLTIDPILAKNVERSTSIWDIVSGTNTQRKETLWTNNLVQTNTDINLSLNEELHDVWDEQYVKIWFGWYYQNFKWADKKLIYAGSSTSKQAILLKREDFVYQWNLNISIESNIASEDRKRKEWASAIQIYPLISADLNPASKVLMQRFLADRTWMPSDVMEEVITDTPQMTTQKLENDLLKQDIFVPITPNDDHEQHLIALWNTIDTAAWKAHLISHLMEFVKIPPQTQTQPWLNENAMNNSMASQAMSQAWSTLQTNI